MTTQRDINNQIKFAQDKGYAEGEQIARIKMAKSLKELGVSVDVIAKASGLWRAAGTAHLLASRLDAKNLTRMSQLFR